MNAALAATQTCYGYLVRVFRAAANSDSPELIYNQHAITPHHQKRVWAAEARVAVAEATTCGLSAVGFAMASPSFRLWRVERSGADSQFQLEV